MTIYVPISTIRMRKSFIIPLWRTETHSELWSCVVEDFHLCSQCVSAHSQFLHVSVWSTRCELIPDRQTKLPLSVPSGLMCEKVQQIAVGRSVLDWRVKKRFPGPSKFKPQNMSLKPRSASQNWCNRTRQISLECFGLRGKRPFISWGGLGCKTGKVSVAPS